MITKLLSKVSFLMFVLLFSSYSIAQTNPDKPKQPNVSVSMKNYWCAEVENLIFSKEPKQGEKLTVGVRIKFTKNMANSLPLPKKNCQCAFEGPQGNLVSSWSKILSLRLIGIKYSEKEVNFLEYYGPTPAFPPYYYSGFPVIGFRVTESDLKRGYLDIWSWVSKEPLQCRESSIYASLAIYNKLPYNIENECHPKEDFKKTFKPLCLDISGIDKEKLTKDLDKTKNIRLPDLEIDKVKSFFRISKRENEQAIIYDELDLVISIKNSGNVDISKFKILIEKKREGDTQYTSLEQLEWSYDGKKGSSQNGIIEIDNLKAGQTKDIIVFTNNSKAPKLDCWLRVKLDPENEISEINETNNMIDNIRFPSHYNNPGEYGNKVKRAP